MHAEIAEYAQR